MSSSSATPESADRPHASTSFWRDVAHALQGEQHDYTKEKLNRAILLLAVPMVLEMVMESLFAIVDVFWVSRLGRDAVAVIGLTESVMSLVYAVAIGISFAATAIVARRIGEKDPQRAARTAAQIVMLGVTIAAGLGLVLGYFAPDILSALQARQMEVAEGLKAHVSD
jgi:Na+-driven multidrug efflux pump